MSLTLSEQSEADRQLSFGALKKVVRAVEKGHLPPRTRIEWTGYTQVILHNAGDLGDYGIAWLQSTFGEGTIQKSGYFAHSKENGRKLSRREGAHLVIPLRGPVERKFYEDHPPRIEVWDVTVAHVCSKPQGRIEGNRVVWRCGVHGCNRAIPAAAIQELQGGS